MARTELFSKHQPGGVFTIANWTSLPHDGWFVDSEHSNASDAVGYGNNPDAPFATLDYAFTGAAEGDKVYVAPWHAENITTATGVNADVAGVTVEGVRMGNLMPTFTMTAAAGSVTVAAANVTLKNLKLVAGFATGCTVALTIPATATGLTLDGLVLRDTTTNLEWLLHATVATAAADLTIRNCEFVGLAGTMARSIYFVGTSTNTLIENNYFFVDSSDSVIDHSAAAGVNCVIRNNTIINQDTGAAGYCIEHHADTTGVAGGNFLAYQKVDAEIGVGAKVWWFENYATNTVGTSSGVLDPAAGAAVP